ncbi:MAG TPA: hypothetical protein VLT33_20825, partial [Labilithrix sp.]|nr:hypothetical protein [Labilithrix sp.]
TESHKKPGSGGPVTVSATTNTKGDATLTSSCLRLHAIEAKKNASGVKIGEREIVFLQKQF